MKYKYYAIDFDGTIVEDAFPKIGKLKPHVIRVMKRIVNSGGRIAINTCRCGKYAYAAQGFLDACSIPYHTFNETDRKIIEMYADNPRKLSADVYIDDKNIFCNDIDWLAIEKEIFGNNKE
jgi:hypothetical protein